MAPQVFCPVRPFYVSLGPFVPNHGTSRPIQERCEFIELLGSLNSRESEELALFVRGLLLVSSTPNCGVGTPKVKTVCEPREKCEGQFVSSQFMFENQCV